MNALLARLQKHLVWSIPGAMLLGLGFTNFSMNALAIAEIKRVFTRIDFVRLRRIVSHLERFGSRTEIEGFLRTELEKAYPGLLQSPSS